MRELASILHSHGKIVTIDVSGKTWDDTSGWGGAWDYRALGEACDYVCIMCYDYHWSGSEAGPIGPLGWLRKVVKYALSTIPREKIVIGIPFYGYRWLGRNGVGLTFDRRWTRPEALIRSFFSARRMPNTTILTARTKYGSKARSQWS